MKIGIVLLNFNNNYAHICGMYVQYFVMRAWFLNIAFVHECVRACVCESAPETINN